MQRRQFSWHRMPTTCWRAKCERPQRYAGFAHLPMQDPNAATAELQRASKSLDSKARSSTAMFEASPYRTAPKGQPSSLVQHDAFASS